MSTNPRIATADMETIRWATERRDSATLAGIYADDATIQIVDRTHPPSRPLELRGQEAISAYLTDIYGRDMTHRIEHEVIGSHRLSFTQACQYADGARVLAATVLDLADGRIIRQVSVQAWDE